MIRPRWRKVIHDIWGNKARTVLVVTSIFIGIFAIGVTTTMYATIGEDLNTSWEATNPAHATLYVSPYEPELLEGARRLPGVAKAEGGHSANVRVKVGPDEWIPLSLRVRPDWEDISIDLVKPVVGEWPPDEHKLVIEKGSLSWIKAKIGDEVVIKLADDTIRNITLVGVVSDMQAGIGSKLGVNGYVTYGTLEWLHEDQSLTSLGFTVSENWMDKTHIEQVADQVSDFVRKSGGDVWYVFVPTPGEHPGYTQMLGVLAVVGALGFMSLFLGGFLIANTLSALLAQHVRYIGVMKAVGGKRSQIMVMYLVLIVIFCVLALVPAIPLAAFVAGLVSTVMAQQFNYNTLGIRPVPTAIGLQVVFGFGIPLLAGILPVITGTRITIQEALSSYGLGKGHFGQSRVDQLVEKIRGLSRPLLISIRNTMRRKGRLALTLITLAVGGAIFVAVFNLKSSMEVFIDQIGKYFLSDVNVDFNQAYPNKKIESFVMQIPGVKRVESWSGAGGELLREDGKGTDTISIIAPPVDSDLIEPQMLKGRWLQPGDENAIVLNNGFWKNRPDLEVGDEIMLKINNRETTWKVVGFFKFPGDFLLSYTTYEYLSELVHEPNRAFSIRIIGEDHSPAAQEKLAKQVEVLLKSRGMQVGSVQTGSLLTEANAQAINVIMGFFMFFAILVALVGAIGLMGTMSMNVMERIREIGVMRAIGASNGAIFRIVLVEGMLIGLISWALGALAAFPISQVLYDILSRALFQTEGKAVITQDGFIIWLIIAVSLSAIASLLPARSASRTTVRDVLAYE